MPIDQGPLLHEAYKPARVGGRNYLGATRSFCTSYLHMAEMVEVVRPECLFQKVS